ncbi:MAG: tRNA (adenosine(37)-N6)-threonylcarbamoyltransferase complex ATPase subunit type 1 TsaE [Ruminococcaceae bacterium]|nr:tRNA (adenosine(37)-N6)-threonylcarbamoyltransferase complex ATPase subunit type 1 TsaE [Oscillospiraceae bacterium]
MTLPLTCQTASAGETEQLGRQLADWLLREPALPSFVALYGDLGVGKTAFVRGFTAALAPDARVKSPTFSLVHEYRSAHRSVFHFDMYRIESEDDLYSIGFFDYWDRDGICLVEWSEHIEYALPDRYLRVELTKDSPEEPDSRKIVISLVGEHETERL